MVAALGGERARDRGEEQLPVARAREHATRMTPPAIEHRGEIGEPEPRRDSQPQVEILSRPELGTISAGRLVAFAPHHHRTMNERRRAAQCVANRARLERYRIRAERPSGIVDHVGSSAEHARVGMRLEPFHLAGQALGMRQVVVVVAREQRTARVPRGERQRGREPLALGLEHLRARMAARERAQQLGRGIA